MRVVDSSGWIEFFTEGPLADEYLDHLTPLDESRSEFRCQGISQSRTGSRNVGWALAHHCRLKAGIGRFS